MLPLLLLPFVLVSFSLCLYSFLIFDRILKIEHSEFPSDWERDGRPTGFFWKPPDGRFLEGSAARSSLAFEWVFSPPPWSKRDSRTEKLFKKLRTSVFTFWALCVGIFVAMFLLAGA
jgi:hypothetical protein